MAALPARGLHRPASRSENHWRRPRDTDRSQCRPALQSLQSQRRPSTPAVRSFAKAGVGMLAVANQSGAAVTDRAYGGIPRPVSLVSGFSTGPGRYTRRLEACKCRGSGGCQQTPLRIDCHAPIPHTCQPILWANAAPALRVRISGPLTPRYPSAFKEQLGVLDEQRRILEQRPVPGTWVDD
jgi:hypothetical protein